MNYSQRNVVILSMIIFVFALAFFIVDIPYLIENPDGVEVTFQEFYPRGRVSYGIKLTTGERLWWLGSIGDISHTSVHLGTNEAVVSKDTAFGGWTLGIARNQATTSVPVEIKIRYGQ
jgi:hypothetical protein